MSDLADPVEVRNAHPRTTTIYMNEETHLLLQRLCEQTGMSQSAFVRSLIHQAGKEDYQTQVREHVHALAKLVL